MTEDELYEAISRNLAAEVKAAAERAQAVPISIRLGKNASLQQVAEELGLAAYRRVKHNRAYAVATDPVARLELGALAVAARQSRKSLAEILNVLAAVAPGWLQERPAEDAGTVPNLPVDPVTGERIRNPWLPLPPKDGETSSRYDYGSQNVIQEQSLRLARWLEQCAEHGGPTAKMLDQLEAERLEADHRRKIPYGPSEWQANKLRPDSATLTEQNLFAKSITDPWVLELHRAEAKAGSPRAGFDNLTVRMALAKRSPEIREVHKAAGELLKQWKQEQQQKAA
jgi:hypothetical protein